MSRLSLTSLLLLLAACGGSSGDPGATSPPAPQAAIDQQFLGPAIGPGETFDTQRLGQTFTAGVTGMLTQLELPIGQHIAGGALRIDVRLAPGGTPVEDDAQAMGVTVIANGTYDASMSWRTIVLSAPVPVAAGSTYAISIWTPGPGGYIWNSADTDTDPSRQAYTRIEPVGQWVNQGIVDLLFKTWVVPVP